MYTEKMTYFHDETPCIGFIAYDNQIQTKRPVVLVVHAWRGQDDFAREKAVEIAELGYIGFAVDIYGDGKCGTNEEAPQLMAPFFADRTLLQERIGAALTFVKKHPQVDSNRIGAIGFCFGGLTVYELLRSGASVQAVVCFHGVFAIEREGQKAKMAPLSPDASGKLLILHGHEDPMVSDDDLKRVQNEMTDAGIDWQIHIYGNTMHAFTNPAANNPEMGTVYNAISAKRAWHSMQDLFSSSGFLEL